MNSFDETYSVSIFDVDGTLIQQNIGVTFVKFLLSKKLVRILPKLAIYALYPLYRAGFLDFKYAIYMGAWALAGIRCEDVARAADQCFATHIQPNLYTDAIEEITLQKRDGSLIVLATGAHKSIAQCLGRFLNADAVIATESAENSGIHGWTLSTPMPYREGKRDLVAQWIKARKGTARTTVYVDDGKDLPLLNLGNRKVAVNADRETNNFALANGGEVRSFR